MRPESSRAKRPQLHTKSAQSLTNCIALEWKYVHENLCIVLDTYDSDEYNVSLATYDENSMAKICGREKLDYVRSTSVETEKLSLRGARRRQGLARINSSNSLVLLVSMASVSGLRRSRGSKMCWT
jgi:hypothetical protein